MPSRTEQISRLLDHPWKKVLVQVVWNIREDARPERTAWVFFKVIEPRTGETWYAWEHWADRDLDGNYVVYRWVLDRDEIEDLNIDFGDLSDKLNADPYHLMELANSSDPRVQGLIYPYLVHAYGPEVLPAQTEGIPLEELKMRWPELDWRNR